MKEYQNKNMFYLLLATYGTILLSELMGDKSIYTISSLTMRFHPLYVFCGFTAAFMVKMLVPVLLGQVIAELPSSVVAITSSATFFLTALVIWRKRGGERPTTPPENYFSRVALITFAAIMFSEWGDAGQMMTATLAARYRVPLVVWLGATLALMTKGLLALTLGRGLRRHVPLRMLRPLSASLCAIMGVISAVGPIFKI